MAKAKKLVARFEPTEPTPGYWAALGEFVHEFSAVERTLQMLLRYQAKTTDKVARAVFSGARSDACRDFVNRVCDATGRADVKERLSVPFSQLGVITSARNAVIHWGTSKLPDATLVVENGFLAHIPERERTISVSPEILRQMTEDLKLVDVMMVLEIVPSMKQTPKITALGVRAKAAVERALNARGSTGPWLYRPTQQALPEKGTRARRRERKHQDASSRR